MVHCSGWSHTMTFGPSLFLFIFVVSEKKTGQGPVDQYGIKFDPPKMK